MQLPNCKYLSDDKQDLQLVLIKVGSSSHVLQSGWHFSHLKSSISYVPFGHDS